MAEWLLLLGAIGCVGAAVYFAKSPEVDWGSVALSITFAAFAGSLATAAAG